MIERAFDLYFCIAPSIKFEEDEDAKTAGNYSNVPIDTSARHQTCQFQQYSLTPPVRTTRQPEHKKRSKGVTKASASKIPSRVASSTSSFDNTVDF